MRRNIFLSLLLGLSLWTSLAVALENNEMVVDSSRFLPLSLSPGEWPRVQIKFNCKKFLQESKEEYQHVLGNLDDFRENNYENCWQALFRMKSYYKNECDTDNLIFTYQSMAKLVLGYDVYPQVDPEKRMPINSREGKKKFLAHLIDNIGKNYLVSPREASCKKDQKIKKWFHIYAGMLFRKYAEDFAINEEKKNYYLGESYNEFLHAAKLKTTKTVYYLLAENILDYGFIPPPKTKEEAERAAYSYIQKAAKS